MSFPLFWTQIRRYCPQFSLSCHEISWDVVCSPEIWTKTSQFWPLLSLSLSETHEIWRLLQRLWFRSHGIWPCILLSGPHISGDLHEISEGLNCDHMKIDPISHTMSWDPNRFGWVLLSLGLRSFWLTHWNPILVWDLLMFEFLFLRFPLCSYEICHWCLPKGPEITRDSDVFLPDLDSDPTSFAPLSRWSVECTLKIWRVLERYRMRSHEKWPWISLNSLEISGD